MLDSIAPIGAALREARKKKGYSQRALKEKTGVPQGHLSKIENGEIDLQTSSLIQISRALDLELMLIPRELIPTINGLLHGTKSSSQKQIPAYRLDDFLEDNDDQL